MKFIEFRYSAPSPPTGATKDVFEQVELLCEDLDHLLHLKFTDFWNELLFNRSLLCSINSVLTRLPRFELDDIPANVAAYIQKLLALLLGVMSRASDPETNKFERVFSRSFGATIYENYIFDIPLMIDLCSVYYEIAHPQLVTIISRVFFHQEKYWQDVERFIDTLPEIFRHVELALVNALRDYEWFIDITQFICDISWSLHTFLAVLAQLTTRTQIAAETFRMSLPEHLASFFESVVAPLQVEIETDLQLTTEQRNKCSDYLSRATFYLVTAVRNGIIEPFYLSTCHHENPPSKCRLDSGATPDTTTSQNFLKLMLQLLNYRRFTLALQSTYSLDNDLSLLYSSTREHLSDPTVQYLIRASESILSERLENFHENSLVVSTHSNTDNVENLVPQSSLNGRVQEVQDVLPQLDVEFIKRCLIEYNNDTGRVINAALEGSIPEHVFSLRDKKPKKPEATQIRSSTASTTTIQANSNQLWQGKFQTHTSASPTHLTRLSGHEKRFTLHSAISVWEDDENELIQSEELEGLSLKAMDQLVNTLNDAFLDDYEDEYDDTYELHEGAVDDMKTTTEPTCKDFGEGCESTAGFSESADHRDKLVSFRNSLLPSSQSKFRGVIRQTKFTNSEKASPPGHQDSKMAIDHSRQEHHDGLSSRCSHSARLVKHNRRRLADKKRQL